MFVPRGIRNNNFGNIEDGSFAQGLPGYTGTDGRFATFASPQDGLSAIDKLLNVYGTKHGINTVNGVVNRWAPGSDGNDTSSYASHLASVAGVDPNAPIDLSDPAVRSKLAQGIAEHENGASAFNAVSNGAGAPTATPAAQSGPSIDQTAYALDPNGSLAQRGSGNFGPGQTAFAGKRPSQDAGNQTYLGSLVGMNHGVTSSGMDVGSALTGVGASLASISNPQQGAALAALNKPEDNFATTYNPKTGALIRINKKSGEVKVMTQGVPQENKFDDAYDAKLADEQIKARTKYQENAVNAASSNRDLDAMQQALANPNVPQGPWGSTRVLFMKAANALGVDNAKDLSDVDVINTVGSKMALKLRNPADGAGMPGNFSDQDRNFLMGIVPGVNLTPEGNARVLELARAANDRAIAIDQMRRDFERTHGGRLGTAFEEEVAKWDAGHKFASSYAQRETSGAQAPAASAQAAPQLNSLKQKYGLQ